MLNWLGMIINDATLENWKKQHCTEGFQNINSFGIILELIKFQQVLLASCGTCAFFPSTK